MESYEYAPIEEYEEEGSGTGLKIGLIVTILAVVIIIIIIVISLTSGSSTPSAPATTPTSPATPTTPSAPTTPSTTPSTSPAQTPHVAPLPPATPTFPPVIPPGPSPLPPMTYEPSPEFIAESNAQQEMINAEIEASKAGSYGAPTTIGYIRRYPYNGNTISLSYFTEPEKKCYISESPGMSPETAAYNQVGWYIDNRTRTTLTLEFLNLATSCTDPNRFTIKLAEVPSYGRLSWDTIRMPNGSYPLLSLACSYRLIGADGYVYASGDNILTGPNYLGGPVTNFILFSVAPR